MMTLSPIACLPSMVAEPICGSNTTFGKPMSSGVTSIQVNEVMPYVQSGQMVGVLAGMPGAAEYESLIGQKGSATSGMDAQSVAHLVIVLFIVLGNISYFIDRKRSRKY